MKKITRILALALPVLVALQGCKKETGPKPEEHEYYQPVKLGEWYQYTVDSTAWSYGVDTTTVKYTLFESYDTDVPNSSGKLETRIKVERVDALPRRVIGFSYVQRFLNASTKEYSVERVDKGVRYILFRTPVVIGDVFNRNDKNLLPAESWQNTAVGSPGSGISGNYEHTMRITKYDYQDSVSLALDYELYAFNVGMYYKEYTYITGRTDLPNWKSINIMDRIATGYSYKKVLVNKGPIK